eukprot:590749-Prorocentrum_minimum.AAC.1
MSGAGVAPTLATFNSLITALGAPPNELLYKCSELFSSHVSKFSAQQLVARCVSTLRLVTVLLP